MIRSSPLWVVIVSYEGGAPMVFPFDDEATARPFFDSRREGWTDVYLCKVIEPIREPNV